MEQRLVAIGDSITLGHWDPDGGWIARLRHASDTIVVATAREQYAAVYNLGISSNTSRDVLERFEGEVDARLLADEKEEAFIVLAVGINDSHTKGGEPVTDIDRYRQNMEALVTLALARTSRVVVVGLTPVDEQLTLPVRWGDKFFSNDRIGTFDDVAMGVARGAGVAYADLFSDPMLRTNDVHLDWDGLHLNAKGHERVAGIVGAVLAETGWRAWPPRT